MTHFILGCTFGLFLWLWVKESLIVPSNQKKQIAWVAGMILSMLLAWLV